MRFYPLTSAGRIRHISRFPGIYCSLLDHLTSLVQTLRPQNKPGTHDETFVCNSVLQTKVSSCVRPRNMFQETFGVS